MNRQWQKNKEYIKKISLLTGVCGVMILTACRKRDIDESSIHEEDISESEGDVEEQETEDSTELQDLSNENDRDLEEEQSKREDLMKENEDRFFRMAGDAGLDGTKAADYYMKLCEDNVFQDGIMGLVDLYINDIDENGQKDMVVMVQNPEDVFRYGTGCIYFYINEDEPYCFEDEGYPFFSGISIISGDFDRDGNIEIGFESRGTGNGGTGDWHLRLLKYKDHSMEKMEFPSDSYEDDERGIKVQVIQEPQENTYSAYCPYLDESIMFEAENAAKPKERRTVGGNSRGFLNLERVEYEGGYGIQVSEYLYGEGGTSHGLGLAKFIIVWEKDKSSRIAQWWIEAF